jgi:multiple sugar transport system substrate-binding protein
MKKKSFLILVCLALSFVLAFSVYATGGSEQKPAEGKPASNVELVVFSHMVHQTAMEGVEGGGKNLVREFISLHPAVSSVRFITAGTPQIKDKLFREAALPRTEFDISLVYTPWISPAMSDFFVPLDDYIGKSPIEDYNDIFQNLRDPLIIGGRTYAVPMRASGEGLFYNKKILAERGITTPPETLEELVEAIKKCSFIRANGEAVYGLVKPGIKGQIGETVADYFRPKDADYCTPDYKLMLTDSRVLEAIELFKEFYSMKAIPPDFFTMENKDFVEMFKRGRAAFTGAGPSYMVQFTGADGLKEEDIGYMNYQAAREYKGKYPAADPTLNFQWAFVIPKGSQHKDLSWEFIRFICSKDGVFNQSFSGNEPIRASTFQDPRYIETHPLYTQQQNIFKYGRPLWNGFDNYTEANDILGEELQRAIAGQKPVLQSMQDAERRIQPLLP